MSRCGCACNCHADENAPWWPGPCAGCCEPGMDCDCGRALAALFTVIPDRHAGQADPIHGEKPSLICPDCGQIFTAYYYRMHRGGSWNERCPSITPR